MTRQQLTRIEIEQLRVSLLEVAFLAVDHEVRNQAIKYFDYFLMSANPNVPYYQRATEFAARYNPDEDTLQ